MPSFDVCLCTLFVHYWPPYGKALDVTLAIKDDEHGGKSQAGLNFSCFVPEGSPENTRNVLKLSWS